MYMCCVFTVHCSFSRALFLFLTLDQFHSLNKYSCASHMLRCVVLFYTRFAWNSHISLGRLWENRLTAVATMNNENCSITMNQQSGIFHTLPRFPSFATDSSPYSWSYLWSRVLAVNFRIQWQQHFPRTKHISFGFFVSVCVFVCLRHVAPTFSSSLHFIDNQAMKWKRGRFFISLKTETTYVCAFFFPLRLSIYCKYKTVSYFLLARLLNCWMHVLIFHGLLESILNI